MLKAICLILLISFLSACKPSGEANKFVATDITGADFGQSFSLTDHTGKLRSMADFKGKVVALFFGYTHCPDVCPTTMHDLKLAMKLLGDQSDQVQVLFVTLDPVRDSQALLAQFIPSFDPRFIALRGSEEEIAATAAVFKIYAKKIEAQGKGGYTVDHSAGMYVFDKEGKIRLYVDYGEKPADIANDIKQLL
ncbi:SCO family protein [Methylotenera sp.]|uniref:SCO family protein n=1 Tax=Methylotenera sp. TaxID=2051956 RepID=UPI0027199D47|nr:SCO family protein [Methylotenera sp.]MDO9206192.1 SCO family protein [Methylotenera sp.]MDP1523738.1 SCO family protein [Methylotenera sp.]MDP2230237.1 SCO family protein [Methylotenera sp.]MDP3005756.1 SCO family protein [Methylotenera sp.]MDP3140185.1 SCO family protein [Methylotenera sp.]